MLILLLALLGLSSLGLYLLIHYVFSGKIVVSPVLCKLGVLEIRYYSLLILFGILSSYLLARRVAKKQGMNLEQLDEMIFYSVLMGIIGARLFYVIFNMNYYLKHPIEILTIWRGGLSIYGAIVFGILTVVMYCVIKKPETFTLWQVLDLGAAFFPLGQSIGRWGNFFNYEAYGAPTDLPWKMYVPPRFRITGYEEYEFFHPTFLYESMWNLFVFLLLQRFERRYKKAFGETFGLYLVLYSIGRIFIEQLRLDSLYIGSLRASQIMAGISIVVGMVIFLKRRGARA